MNKKTIRLKMMIVLLFGIILYMGMVPLVFADVYINVMAVNGSPTKKETDVKSNLPSDVAIVDVLDADGLQVDYNIADANVYVHGKVTLEPKESKTFKVRIRDLWKTDPQQIEQTKKEIEEGFNKLGTPHDPKMAEQLKDYLLKKIEYILDAEGAKAETVEKRIDSFRTYRKELQRVKNNALAVDYWRSDINDVMQPKLVHMNIEVENPATATKKVKYKQFLPAEVKPEHVIEAEGFDVRYDQQRQQSFLFKEEEMTAGEKKKYTIGMQDIWTISQKEIDYFSSRAKYASEFLSNTRFADSAKYLDDRIVESLKQVEDAQVQPKPVDEHISLFRTNQKIFQGAQTDVETLEKLLSVYREDLEKSKVNNILQRVQSLKGVANVSKAVFNKKFESSTAFSFIGWIMLFVGLLTAAGFIVWLFRSKEKRIIKEELADKIKEPVEGKQKK